MLFTGMLNFTTTTFSHVAMLAPVCHSLRGNVATVRVFIFQFIDKVTCDTKVCFCSKASPNVSFKCPNSGWI